MKAKTMAKLRGASTLCVLARKVVTCASRTGSSSDQNLAEAVSEAVHRQ